MPQPIRQLKKLSPKLKHLRSKGNYFKTSISYVNVGKEVTTMKDQFFGFNLEDKVVSAEGVMLNTRKGERQDIK